jgi:hypothetical protein
MTMRILRLLVAGGFAALSLVVVTAAPSFACSCAETGTADHVKGADVVMLGVIEDRQGPPLRAVMSSGDPATYTVAVEQVFKGAAPPRTYVLSPDSGASCGLEFIETGARYVVFADENGAELWASLCGGTAGATPAFVAEVEAATGQPVRPDPELEPAFRPTAAGGLALPAGLLAGGALVALTATLWARMLRRS